MIGARPVVAAASLGVGLAAVPLFGQVNLVLDVAGSRLPSLLLPWSALSELEFWVPLLAACVTVAAVAGMTAAIAVATGGWHLVASWRYRVAVLLLSCVDFAFLLAPGLAKWGAFWGREAQDLTSGPFPECDCAIADPLLNHLAGVWIELQFVLSIAAVVIAVITVVLPRSGPTAVPRS